MRVFAYIARRYNSAAESTSLLSSVASLAKHITVMSVGKMVKRWANVPFEERITSDHSFAL